MKLIQKFLKTLMLYLVFNVYHSDAQSDTILFRNIGYLVGDQICTGNLKIYKTGFCFNSQNENAIRFQQDFISLKKHIVSANDFQIQFYDVAIPVYTLEFESQKQLNFMKSIISSKKKKKFFSQKLAENIAGEFIKNTWYRLR